MTDEGQKDRVASERGWVDARAGTGEAAPVRGIDETSWIRQTWNRVVAVLRLEPGIAEEIGRDPESTKQGLAVAAVANAVASLLALPLLPIVVPLAVGMTAIAAKAYSLIALLFTDEVPPYSHWLRAMLFASAPGAFGIVPFVGTFVGGVYSVVLQIVAIRDLARISTGTAIMVWVILVLIGTVLAAAVVLLFAATWVVQLLDLFK